MIRASTDQGNQLQGNFTRVKRTLPRACWVPLSRKLDFQHPVFLAFKHLQRVSNKELCKSSSPAKGVSLAKWSGRHRAKVPPLLSVPTQTANLHLLLAFALAK